MQRRWIAAVGLGLALVLLLVAVLFPPRNEAPRVDVVDAVDAADANAPAPPGDDAGSAGEITYDMLERALGGAVRAVGPPPAREQNQCAATANEAIAFLQAERSAGPQLQARARAVAVWRAELESLPRRLLLSPDPDLFTAGLVLDRPEARVRQDPSVQATLVDLGLRADASDSPLLEWHALRICVEADAYCPFAHLEQSLLESLSTNAEAWALAATLRYRRGDVAGALAAMQSAARAPTSTWYWTETSAAIARAFAEQTSIPYGDGAAGATGAATSGLPSDSGVRQMCEAQAATSRDWARACFELGSLRGRHNETMLGQGGSYALRRQMLEALGDTEGVAALAEEHALFSAERLTGRDVEMATSSSVRNALLAADPERLDAYLNLVREHGETEGNRAFLRREVPLLFERAGLLDRDGARECAAQFFETPTAAMGTFRDYPIAEYPLRAGDELLIFTNRPEYSGVFRVGADGTIALRRLPAVAAAGETTGRIRNEIAALVGEATNAIPDVSVTLMVSPSPEQRRIDFDEALREAKQVQQR